MLIYMVYSDYIIQKAKYNMKNRILFVIFLVITILLCFPLCACASEDKAQSRIAEAMNEFIASDGRIIGVSSKGEWDNCPENSLAAIREAAKTDIDFVLLDIKMTADNKLIVFSDDTTERMLNSENIMNISETDFSVLSDYYLRYACGGSNEKVSSERIPSLESALDEAVNSDIPLILRCEAAVIPAVCDVLSENNALDMCIIMCADSKTDIETALLKCKEQPYIIGSKKGNVIFAMNSFGNYLEDIGALGYDLKTSNRYGINYYKSVVGNYAESMRVIADPTTPEICGHRQDSEKWWSDLISRGYSVIITDHAAMFSEYIERTDKARSRLQDIYNKYVTEHTLPDFRDDILNDYKKAYTDAVSMAESLLSDNSSSVQDLNDCYSLLSKAANDININFTALEQGSAGTTFTVPRIILCALFVAAVVTVQIYFFKRRKKEG